MISWCFGILGSNANDTLHRIQFIVIEYSCWRLCDMRLARRQKKVVHSPAIPTVQSMKTSVSQKVSYEMKHNTKPLLLLLISRNLMFTKFHIVSTVITFGNLMLL